jgi:hypothetical protein
LIERDAGRVGAEDEDDLGVLRVAHECDAVEAVVLAVLADEEGRLHLEGGEGHLAGADGIDEVIARDAHPDEALAVGLRALARIGEDGDGDAAIFSSLSTRRVPG